MEKRVLISAVVVLFASFLAFNFGEENPTGLVYKSSVPTYVLGISPIYGEPITQQDMFNLGLVHGQSLRVEQTGDEYARNFAESLVKKYGLERFDIDGNGIISYQEYRAASDAYSMQSSSKSSEADDTANADSCSKLQAGEKFCGIGESKDRRPMLVCTKDPSDPWKYTLLREEAPPGQTCSYTIQNGVKVVSFIRIDKP